MKSIEERIKALGFNLKMFDEELLDGYSQLLQAGIEIPDNILNPNICTGFFGVYCLFIAEDNETELLATIPYLRPGMTFMHCKQITKALNANNKELLKKYDIIFSNMEISKSKKISLAELAEMGAPYEHLLAASVSDLSAKEEWRTVLNEKYPLPDILEKINHSSCMR